MLNITLDDQVIAKIPEKILDLKGSSTFYKMPNLQSGNFEEIFNKRISLTLSNILYFIYFLILVALLIRSVKNFMKLLHQNRMYQKVYYQGNKIVLLDFKTNPYTFFNTIFVCKDDYQNGLIDKDILRHEIEHKNQLHSIDILVLELIQIVYWFNPLIYLYKLAVKANHEYLADNSIILSGTINHVDYSHKIINYTFRIKQVSLVSQANYLLTKKRIIMLATKKNTKRNLSRI